MNLSWALVIVFVVSYLIGSVNIAKIISWQGWHKKIENEGSGNPGTMNMLRTFGLKAAILTLLLEIVKAGLTAWLCAFITRGYGLRELVFYFSGFAIVLGSCFPFFGTMKGGKGVACCVGFFLFSNIWYIGLALFAISVVVIVFTDIGFLSSLTFILGMSIATTIYIFVAGVPYSWLICVLVWVCTALILIKHHKNFYRLFKGVENKTNFKQACKNMFKKKEKVEAPPSGEVVRAPEVEVLAEEKPEEQAINTQDVAEDD